MKCHENFNINKKRPYKSFSKKAGWERLLLCKITHLVSSTISWEFARSLLGDPMRVTKETWTKAGLTKPNQPSHSWIILKITLTRSVKEMSWILTTFVHKYDMWFCLTRPVFVLWTWEVHLPRGHSDGSGFLDLSNSVLVYIKSCSTQRITLLRNHTSTASCVLEYISCYLAHILKNIDIDLLWHVSSCNTYYFYTYSIHLIIHK